MLKLHELLRDASQRCLYAADFFVSFTDRKSFYSKIDGGSIGQPIVPFHVITNFTSLNCFN